MQRLTAVLLWLLAGLGLVTGLALLAPWGWPFELFSHFRVQYAAVALGLALLLAWRRRAMPALLALLIGGWHALPGFAVSPGAVASPACAGPMFTVATVNVQFSNERHDAFRAWLATQPADFLVIQEVTAAWGSELDAQAAYPYRHVVPREDPYGLALLSRTPLGSVLPVDLAGDGSPSLAGLVEAGGQPLRFLGLHAHWPVTPSLAAARDRALQAAAALASTADEPVVLLGDLNLTPDSPAFDRLLARSGLRDALQGGGWRPTWLAGFWPLALRIDHVLVSSDLCVERAEVGPSIGSDHRPVVVTLRTR